MRVFPRLTRAHLQIVLLVAVFITLSITLASIDPEYLIETVGVQNAYVLMFLLGALGGLTTFTGIPYHFVLISFVAGGLSPIYLGIVTALGVMLGDSTMFVIGKRVAPILPEGVQLIFARIGSFFRRHPATLAPSLVAYGTFSPFSNDFLVAGLSIAGFTYWRIVLPLTIGNILYNIAIGYLGIYAYDSIISFL